METKQKMRKREKFPSENFRYIKKKKHEIVNYMCNLLHAFVATGSDVNGRKSDSFFFFLFFLHLTRSWIDSPFLSFSFSQTV